jgi:hypothetical protein
MLRRFLLLMEYPSTCLILLFFHTQIEYWWQSSGRLWFHLPCAPTSCCSHTQSIKLHSLYTLRRVPTLLSWMPATRSPFINVVCWKTATACSESCPSAPTQRQMALRCYRSSTVSTVLTSAIEFIIIRTHNWLPFHSFSHSYSGL